MVDLKKLISGFLVLAAIVSSFALLLSNLLPEHKPAQANPDLISQYPNIQISKVPPRIPPNAFVEPLPEARLAATPDSKFRNFDISSSDGLPPLAPTDNLTENLAQRITREFVAANADGPMALGGEQFALIPDGEKITEALGGILFADPAPKVLPDFSGIAGTDLKFTSGASKEDALRYLDKVNEALVATISNENFDKLLAREPSYEMMSAVQLELGRAVNKLQIISAPKELASFHRSVYALVLNRKKFFDVSTPDPSDPLRSLTRILAAEEKIGEVLVRDAENLKREIRNLNPAILSLTGGNPLSVADKIFGVKIAVAQTGLEGFEGFLGVPPPPEATNPGAVEVQNKAEIPGKTADQQNNFRDRLQKVWEWLKKELWQQIKNSLIKMIQRQVISWVQGGGNPKFITDWENYLGDIYNVAAGKTIAEIVPGLCRPFQPLIGAALRSSYGTSLRGLGSTSCTLERVVSNIENFFGDFNRGGFIAYGTYLSPTGDYWGSFFASSQEVARKASEKKEAAKNTGLAGGGFLGTQICRDSSEPKQGKCADGKPPITITPGQTAGAILATSLKLPAEGVINLQDAANFGAMIDLVVDSALNRLLQEGLVGLSSVFQSDAPSGTSSLCSGLSGQALNDCLNASRNANNASSTEIVVPTAATSTPSGSAALACSPDSQTITASETAMLTASGGDGNYVWSAPGGFPQPPGAVTGQTFSVSYFIQGEKTVTVTSGNATSSCAVTVTP